jgi:hypothetical protein
MLISGAKVILKSVLVRLNPNSLTEVIQIDIQLKQKWNQDKLVKHRLQELADMEDHAKIWTNKSLGKSVSNGLA